jgi:hypothetical protein
MAGGAWWDKPQENSQLILSFDIAESQKILKITFPVISIACTGLNGEKSFPQISHDIEVNEDFYEPIHNSAAFNGFKNLDEGLQINEVGYFEFLDVKREPNDSGGESVSINFEFTNGSAGYQNKGGLSGYLLGNDGVVHLSTTNSSAATFDVGPGLTSEGSMQFLVLNQPQQLALVIEYVYAFDKVEKIPVYQVFKLP